MLYLKQQNSATKHYQIRQAIDKSRLSLDLKKN